MPVIMRNSSAPRWPFALKFIVKVIVAQHILFSINNSLVTCADGSDRSGLLASALTWTPTSTTSASATTTTSTSTSISTTIKTHATTPATIAQPNVSSIDDNDARSSSNSIDSEPIHALGTAAALLSPNDDDGRMDAASRCSLADFTCANGKCVPANKFCDKVNDCGDNSDEPRFCSRK